MAFKRKRAAWLGGAALAFVALGAWYLWGLQNAALISLNQTNLGQFTQTFDTSAAEPRVVLLLSPT